MTTHMARLILVAAASVSLLTLSAQANINFHWFGGSESLHADCPTPNITRGGTDLINLSETWSRAAVPEMINSLRNSYPSWANTPATYTWSDNMDGLNGDLYFDWYKATDVHQSFDPDANDGDGAWYNDPNGPGCRHGAQLTLHYVRAATDPANVDFIQFFSETGNSGSRSYVVDPDPRDDALPFYFTATDVRSTFTHVPDLPGVIFGDSPGDRHPEVNPASGGVTFQLQLASWGSNDHAITLHNYITWGYTWQCIPGPGTISVTILGLLCLTPRRRR